MSAHDLATNRDAIAGPGTDTRAWCHVGQVEPDSGDQHAVSFTAAGPDGQVGPNPFGVQVMVKLQPNGNVLPCRVAASVA
jgi:hypothetical protein